MHVRSKALHYIDNVYGQSSGDHGDQYDDDELSVACHSFIAFVYDDDNDDGDDDYDDGDDEDDDDDDDDDDDVDLHMPTAKTTTIMIVL